MSKKNKNILALVCLTCVFGAGIVWYNYVERVCIQPLGFVGDSSHAYGVYMCFDGHNVEQSMDQVGKLNADAKAMVALLESTKNVEQFIASGQFDATGIEPEQLQLRVNAIRQLWLDTSEKELLFTFTDEKVKKYLIASKYQGKRLLLQVQIQASKSGLNKLRLTPTSDELSKLIARWQALAGNAQTSTSFTLGFLERMQVLWFKEKFCREDDYCFYFDGFQIEQETGTSLGAAVWKRFIELANSGSPSILGSAMDEKSQKNIMLDVSQPVLGPNTKALVDWLNKLAPVAYLYGENFIAIFVGQGNEGVAPRDAYLNGASAPIFFIKNENDEQYTAVGLNHVNYFKNFVGKVNFLDGGDL